MEILRSFSSNGATEIADIWNGWFSSVGTWAAATSAAAFYTSKAAKASADAAKAAEDSVKQWREVKEFETLSEIQHKIVFLHNAIFIIISDKYDISTKELAEELKDPNRLTKVTNRNYRSQLKQLEVIRDFQHEMEKVLLLFNSLMAN